MLIIPNEKIKTCLLLYPIQISMTFVYLKLLVFNAIGCHNIKKITEIIFTSKMQGVNLCRCIGIYYQLINMPLRVPLMLLRCKMSR